MNGFRKNYQRNSADTLRQKETKRRKNGKRKKEKKEKKGKEETKGKKVKTWIDFSPLQLVEMHASVS